MTGQRNKCETVKCRQPDSCRTNHRPTFALSFFPQFSLPRLLHELQGWTTAVHRLRGSSWWRMDTCARTRSATICLRSRGNWTRCRCFNSQRHHKIESSAKDLCAEVLKCHIPCTHISELTGQMQLFHVQLCGTPVEKFQNSPMSHFSKSPFPGTQSQPISLQHSSPRPLIRQFLVSMLNSPNLADYTPVLHFSSRSS